MQTGTGANSRLQWKIKQPRFGSIIIQSGSNAKQGADIIRRAQTFGNDRPKNLPACQTWPIVFHSWSFIFSAPSPGRPAAQCIVMLSYSLSQSSFADSKWSHKCNGSLQIGIFGMPCSCIFYNDRKHFNPAQTRRFCYAIYFFLNFPLHIISLCPFSNFRGGHSQDSILLVGNIYTLSKWLQWIKSKWALWINRGAALVDTNDGKMDGPQPVEIASWFALCIPSIPMGGGHHISLKSMCAWEHAHSSTAPSWPACTGLPVTSATQRAPASSRAAKHPAPPTRRTENLPVRFRLCKSVTICRALDEEVLTCWYQKFIKTPAI